MIVAMEEKNEHLQELLQKEGHTVVPLYGYGGAVDAILYTSAAACEMPLTAQNFGGEDIGIFMLCTAGMTDEAILRALRTKSYSRIL